jgi:phosphoenolpyruvate phosphomutase / 2-hydroxyethylphosphonate cytidylyltransferase
MEDETFKKQLQATRAYSFKPVTMDYAEWLSIIRIGYVGICGDLFHAGHLNILQTAKVYSQIVVAGVLTDEAVESYKRKPVFCFEERCRIMSHLEYVDIMIPQKKLSYGDNLRLVQPSYLFHGKDWATGVQQGTRTEAINVLDSFGGVLIEPDRYEGISTTEIIEHIQSRR